ncbi:MAG: hypothetical protein RLY31_2338 [Bacteroidota bacterium]|jgi:thiol:disulfide interchange protein DsbD
MKKLLLYLCCMAIWTTDVTAQENPVSWSFRADKVTEGVYDVVFKATIRPGWYVYSQYLESDDGPIRTSFHFEDHPGVRLEGKNQEVGKKYEGFDELFGMNIVKFSGEPTFTQRVTARAGTVLSGYLEFMTCDEEKCLPPVSVDFSIGLP